MQMTLNFTHQSCQQDFLFVFPAFCCLFPPAPSHIEEIYADFISSLTPGVGDVMLKAEQGAFNYWWEWPLLNKECIIHDHTGICGESLPCWNAQEATVPSSLIPLGPSEPSAETTIVLKTEIGQDAAALPLTRQLPVWDVHDKVGGWIQGTTEVGGMDYCSGINMGNYCANTAKTGYFSVLRLLRPPDRSSVMASWHCCRTEG